MTMKHLVSSALLTIATVAIFSCTSSIKKADIPASANANEEITKMDQAIGQGYANQVDVLASKEFDKSRAYLKDAKKDLADGDDNSDVLESVAYSKAFLDRATELATGRRAQAVGILEARTKALNAGAKKYPFTEKQLSKIDEKLMGKSEKLDKLTAVDISEYQTDYSNIELATIEESQLGRARTLIDAAREDGARREAPIALKAAEVDYKTAEGLIRANRNLRDNYFQAVTTANRSALFLAAVLAETNDGKVSESVASKVVLQNNRIEKMAAQLDAADVQLNAEKMRLNEAIAGQSGELARQNQELARKNSQLNKANATIDLQQTLARAQAEFSSDEAEVFQQGNNLVIRLKQIQFPSGRAELPTAAMPILAKVRDVAQELGPKSVRVEGHTDSLGTESVNKTLSQSRAQTIANYFSENGIDRAKLETEGMSFSKPLATNKTKEGRAQNRRVDVIITPEGMIQE